MNQKLKLSGNNITIPLGFGNGSEVNHVTYGKGKCIGFVQSAYWRIEFESGEVKDFLPSKLFANLK